MSGVFANQVAVVTGAAQGLGQAIAEMLCSNGASVVLFDMDKDKGEAVAQSLGKQAKFFKVIITASYHWGKNGQFGTVSLWPFIAWPLLIIALSQCSSLHVPHACTMLDTIEPYTYPIGVPL